MEPGTYQPKPKIKKIYERTLRHSPARRAAPLRRPRAHPQGTYTILLSGADTAGHYCLIDMHLPPGGGPPPHRHDFEESFTVLEGEIEATFRGEKLIVHTGQTLSVPANAPHSFANASGAAARLLCICAPAGQEEFFAQVGVPVPTRRSTPPQLDQVAQTALMKKAQELAPKYRTELL
jgi:quercetin dioxygenase-like cupin family protein